MDAWRFVSVSSYLIATIICCEVILVQYCNEHIPTTIIFVIEYTHTMIQQECDMALEKIKFWTIHDNI